MEDTHICIADLAKNFGHNILGEEAISFYGVSSLTSLDITYIVLDYTQFTCRPNSLRSLVQLFLSKHGKYADMCRSYLFYRASLDDFCRS